MSERKTTRHLISGFAGGLASAVALQPLDLLKTRIQQTANTSILTVFRSINSPLDLWRGTVPSALRTSVGSALYLSMLNLSRTYLAQFTGQNGKMNVSSKLPQLTVWANMITGIVSRASVGVLTMPITIIKIRFESNLYNYRSIWDAANSIYTKEGFRGFFNGVGPTCLRDAPYAGLYVSLYEYLKHHIPQLVPYSHAEDAKDVRLPMKYSALVNSSSAIIASVIATGVTAPFDTIKTQMQLNPKQYPSFLTTTRLILGENWKRFFDGVNLRLIRKAGSASIAWVIYEELVKL